MQSGQLSLHFKTNTFCLCLLQDLFRKAIVCVTSTRFSLLIMTYVTVQNTQFQIY